MEIVLNIFGVVHTFCANLPHHQYQDPVQTKPVPVFFMINYPGKVLITRTSTIPSKQKAAHSHKEMLGAMVVTNKMVDKSQSGTMFRYRRRAGWIV